MPQVRCWLWILIIAALLPAIVFVVPFVNTAGQVNAWSVRYLRQGEQPNGVLPPHPIAHRRAPLWLASDALRQGDLSRALSLVSDLVRQNDPSALVLYGEALAVGHDTTGAVEALSRAGDVGTLLSLGEEWAGQGNLDDALLAYRAAQAIDADRGTTYLVNFLLFTKQDYVEAERVAYQAILSAPHARYRPNWLRRWAEALRFQGRLDEAIQAYEQAIASGTDDQVSAHIELGQVYLQRDGVATDPASRALAEFKRAIALDTNRPDGYYAMATALTQAGTYGEADQWYHLALDRKKTDPTWYMARATAAGFANDLDLALEVYSELRARFSDYAPAYYEAAWLYVLQGRKEEAFTAIEKALDLAPEKRESYSVRAGCIYQLGGDPVKARAAFTEALALNPANRDALQGIADLGAQ